MSHKFVPTLVFSSVYKITEETLKPYSSILIDLDGTLESSKTAKPSKELADWITYVASLGKEIIVFSNNNENRVSIFCENLPVKHLSKAKKPFQSGFSKALAMTSSEKKQVVMIGDQIFTDIFGANLFGIDCFYIESIDKHKPYPKFRYIFEKKFILKGKKGE